MAIDQDEGGEWLTYAEAGQALGISAEAARQLAKRRGWPRRTPNEHNAPAKVCVPKAAKTRQRPAANGGQTPDERGMIDGADRPDEGASVRADEAVVRAVMTALALCREQLERERNRVDRAERLLDEERERAERRAESAERRIGELTASLADAVGAERIAAGDAAALRAELDRRREWRLFRRLRWALRGDRN
jgi:hypothetical protein